MTPKIRWWVYILYSLPTGKLYTGISTHPSKRLDKHNQGKGAKATRFGRPWAIVYTELARTKGNALRREAAIKKMKRKDKLILAEVAA